MYKALFCLAYYGLFRVRELTKSPHVVKAKNVHIAKNKDKIKLTLFSSKTRDRESRPQCIKISAPESRGQKQKFFCPLHIVRKYVHMRGAYSRDHDQLIVFLDGSPATPTAMRKTLCSLLKSLNLNEKLHDCQSFRIGRVTDLLKFNYKIEQIKMFGCWQSDVVYKYLRLCQWTNKMGYLIW